MKNLQTHIDEALFGGFDANQNAKFVQIDSFFENCLTIDQKGFSLKEFDEQFGYEYIAETNTLKLFTKNKLPNPPYDLEFDGWDSQLYPFSIDFAKFDDQLETLVFRHFKDPDFSKIFSNISNKSAIIKHLSSSRDITLQPLLLIEDSTIQSLNGIDQISLWALYLTNVKIDKLSLPKTIGESVEIKKCTISSLENLIVKENKISIQNSKILSSVGKIISKEGHIFISNVEFPDSVQGMTISAPQDYIVFNNVKLNNLRGATIKCGSAELTISNAIGFKTFEGSKIQCGSIYCDRLDIENFKGIPQKTSEMYYSINECNKLKSFEGLPAVVDTIIVKHCQIDYKQLNLDYIPKARYHFEWSNNGGRAPVSFVSAMKNKHASGMNPRGTIRII